VFAGMSIRKRLNKGGDVIDSDDGAEAMEEEKEDTEE